MRGCRHECFLKWDMQSRILRSFHSNITPNLLDPKDETLIVNFQSWRLLCVFFPEMWTSSWSARMSAPFISSSTLCWTKKIPVKPIGAVRKRPLRKGSAWAAERTVATTWATRSTRSEPREAAKCTWRHVLRCPTKVSWRLLWNRKISFILFFFFLSCSWHHIHWFCLLQQG